MIEAFNNNFRFSNFNEKAIHDGELSFDSLSYSMHAVCLHAYREILHVVQRKVFA